MPSPPTAGTLVAQLRPWLDRLFPDAPRRERLTGDLDAAFGADDRLVDVTVASEIERVAHRSSRHFTLEVVPGGGLTPDMDPPGWPPPDPAEVRRRAGWVTHVSRDADGTGHLAVDGLDPVHLAAPFFEAAFELLRGATGLVLDLRRNGGGDPGTLAMILDWLTGARPEHISDVVYKDRTRQWWTRGRGAERALPAPVPVVALIGEGTFSSGEALAYHLQTRGRARLVGGRTPGAADHVTPVRVNAHVRAIIPEAYVRDAVTGRNWEGSGVVPDVACDDAEAMAIAVALVRRGR